MSPDKWERIKSIFAAALAADAAGRSAFLSEACAGDEEMRREVESLLAAHEAAGDFIESPPADAAHLVEAFDQAPPYERVGPYRLLERVGAGGMGSVYRALRDDDEFKKLVAVKIVSRGMSTDFVLRRFRQERQILAGLNHPNITMLLDGGATPDGFPYLVMEYVDGKPILAYCDDNKLSVPERLELFRTVCAAVQYAHKNRVVHRDLKPSNILVAGDGIPKLLDFGIARIFDPGTPDAAAEPTISTRSLMTPEYASPEQVRGEPATPASDIYSLGVLLYELLTRRKPYRIDTPTPQKIAAAVCEQEPEKPSSAVASSKGDAPTEAETKLAGKLRGDLDVIVLTALRKEPQHRYGTVEELSEDIRRHLVGLPLKARKASAAYMLGKFLRRKRSAVLAAALVLATAVAVTGALIIAGIVPFGGKGEIVLLTNPPEVEVLLDGRAVGATMGGSLTLAGLDAGMHRMELRKSGFISLQESLRITRGKNPELKLVLRPALAVLQLRTNVPGVRILVDGRERGITDNDGSALVQDITPEMHSLVLSREGFAEWKDEREFVADRTTEIHTTLIRLEIDPRLALLSITSDPPDALVMVAGIDGIRRGTTSGGSFTLRDLRPGRFAVALEKEGYEKVELSLSLEAGRATTRHFVLAAKPAWLDLATTPAVADAAVRINGAEVGRTSSAGILRAEVSALRGPAILEIAPEGYEREMRNVVLRPGMTETVRIAMIRRGAATTVSMLSVSSAPSEAEVDLDQTHIGTTPLSGVQVPVGQHRITVRKKLYRDRSELVQFLAGEPKALSYTLDRVSGTLRLEVEPAEAIATIEGRSYNAESRKEILLPPGEHSILLECAGYESRQVKVSIADNATTQLRERLESTRPAPGSDQPYSDAFLNLNNWGSQAGWQADGILHVRGAGTSLLRGRSFRNFRQRLSLRLVNGISASLIIRARDAQNFYLIQLNGDGYWEPKLRNTILFHVVKDGKATELAANNLPVEPRKLREWFQIFIEARDTEIRVSVSGKLLSGTTALEAELGRFRDPGNLLPSGGIGFRALRNEVFEVNGLVIEPLQQSR